MFGEKKVSVICSIQRIFSYIFVKQKISVEENHDFVQIQLTKFYQSMYSVTINSHRNHNDNNQIHTYKHKGIFREGLNSIIKSSFINKFIICFKLKQKKMKWYETNMMHAPSFRIYLMNFHHLHKII